ncbi:MAG: hypothetical protein H6656_21145 [Ardenticatenaceae bacterium]|nr:hypothetical protein [Ardenticatenaceae bacterium]
MLSSLDPSLTILLMSGGIIIFAFLIIWLAGGRKQESLGNQILEGAEKRRVEEPEKNIVVYEEAFGRLATYIDNNINQSKNVYRLTVGMILVGFIMVGAGIVFIAFTTSGNSVGEAWPVIAAGVITEFIAATILFVYKSVFQQTADYFQALERLSSVGMSIQILDDLADDQDDDFHDLVRIKVETKAEIAKRLLGLQQSKFVDNTKKN